MLDLQELQNLTEGQIVELLLKQNLQPFEIYIPKSTQKYFSDPESIAIEYAELAYAGQRLSDISDSFEYEEVKPEDHESVLFKISISDLKKLAGTLLEISYGYINDSPDEEFIYAELVEEFLGDVEDSKIVPVCPYFIEVYKEFMADEID